MANGVELGNFTFDPTSTTIIEGDTEGNHGIVDLSGITANYIQITPLNSYGAESYWSISEVRFYEDTNPQIPGDANGDGKVDGSDVTVLADNWQVMTGATWEMGDFNEDGQVDGSDVTILADHWQEGVGGTLNAVPEPSSVLLMLCGLGAFFFRFKLRK